MKFSELQDQLKEKFGIDHLADIARELGVSPQAVSNWKARDRVPYKYVLKIRKQLEDTDTQVSDQIGNAAYDSDQVFPQYSYPHYVEGNTIAFTDILLVLARQLKIIVITPSIICTITIIYALFFTSPFYESTAKIMSSSGDGQPQIGGLASQFGINLGSGQTEPQWVYPEIIKSRTLARTMLKRKFDTIKYGPQKPLLQILTYGNQKKPTEDLDIIQNTGVNGVIGMIDIKKSGSFYNLTISAPEPVFARDFAIALIEELDSHQREYNNSKISETRKFIEKQIAKTELELNTKEEGLRDFRSRNRRIGNSPTLLLEQERLAREVSVLIGVFTTLKQQLVTTKIEEVKVSDYVVVLDPPEAPLHPSKPKKKLMVVLAGIFGLSLGTVIGFVNEYLDDKDDEDKNNLGEVKSLLLQNIKDMIPFKRGWGGKIES